MILHVDMDAFFASVEKLDNPNLTGKCVIVGGLSNRSVVSAASYEAREFGVHSAMPIFRARQKCPQGIFIKPRMHRYKELSRNVMEVLKKYSPVVEQVSIDEAYIDITGCEKLYGEPKEIAFKIKMEIKEKVGLTCSTGIAPSKVLAKISSDINKPDGFFHITHNEVPGFIETLAVQKIPGVGRVVLKKLELLGIRTLGDVKQYPEDVLLKKIGKFGKRLIELSSCIDTSGVKDFSVRKSVSKETTLNEDTNNIEILREHVLKQSENVGRELRTMKVRARTITLKIKDSNHEQITRNITINNPTSSTEIIYREAFSLLDAFKIRKKIRLIGVGTSSLTSEDSPVQMELFNNRGSKTKNWEKVDKAVDNIINKFGKESVKRAVLKKPERKE